MQTAATTERKQRRFRGGDYVASLMAEISAAEIGGRIKQARHEAGLSQHELADALQLHYRTVQNWESRANPTMPEWKRLEDIAGVLGVSKEWLLHGDAAGDPALSEQVNALREELAEIRTLLLEQLGGEHRETS